MVQKTYHFYNANELDKIINYVVLDKAYTGASSVLIQLYNPRLDMDEEAMVSRLRSAFPKACLTGITAANIAGESFDISSFPVEISFTFFTDTVLYQYDFCEKDASPFLAGCDMNNILNDIEDVKCMQIFYTSKSTSVNTFMYEFKHHKIPIFGIKAGRSIIHLNPAHVYGRQVYDSGCVVVIFASKSLAVYMDNNLGWQSIGVEMAITKTYHDNVIMEIDKKPAIDVFSKYLKVQPNEYFVHNVCEFPLIIERDCLQMARVPAAYTDSGGVVFTSDVHTGDHVRLSYANKDMLFSLNKQSADDLASFEPEAVFLFECGNRVRFLKQEYLFEINQYRYNSRQLSSVTGYAEIFVTPDGKGGDLNSSLVAVGLKENTTDENQIILCRTPKVEEESISNANGEIPFVERILAFLESTSQELDAMNKELGKIAYTDQLTHIYNRWELEKKIDESLEFARQGKSHGVIFFDIDHFKHVNDNYGHDVGDMVLLAVVNIIKEHLKEGHAFGRWGGEEFLYLIPDVDEKTLFEFADNIRDTIDKICFVTVQHLTISAGVTLARPDDSIDSFIKRADEAVYEAKETGRNKVVLH